MKEGYVHQVKGYGLGNFVMGTHAINMLSKTYKKPINVYFDDKWIQEYYSGCEEIKPISAPIGQCYFRTSLININEYDGIYIQREVSKKLGIVPTFLYPALTGKFKDYKEPIEVVLISGNGSIDKIRQLKEIDYNVYNEIIKITKEYGFKITAVGNTNDYEERLKLYSGIDEYILNKPSDIASAIKSALFVISNDTGLYHYTAAMNKYQFVMWKGTNLKKNFNPYSDKKSYISRNWVSDYKTWIELIKNKG